MGYLSLREIADGRQVSTHDPDPFPDDPVELSFEEFNGAVDKLTESGFELRADARGGVAALPGVARQLRVASLTRWPI